MGPAVLSFSEITKRSKTLEMRADSRNKQELTLLRRMKEKYERDVANQMLRYEKTSEQMAWDLRRLHIEIDFYKRLQLNEAAVAQGPTLGKSEGRKRADAQDDIFNSVLGVTEPEEDATNKGESAAVIDFEDPLIRRAKMIQNEQDRQLNKRIMKFCAKLTKDRVK